MNFDIYVFMNVHTCICTYIHTYIHSYIFSIIVRNFEYERKLVRTQRSIERMYNNVHVRYRQYGTVQYVLVIKLLVSFQRNTTDSAKIISVCISIFKKNIVRHCSIMYIHTYKRTYVYSFGFGSASYQTKTKPKPYQNHTKTIPKPYQNHTTNRYGFGSVLVWFLVRF